MTEKILIAYYSYSGNTQRIANLIQEKTGGETFNIQVKFAYPESYNPLLEQAKKEIREGFTPELLAEIQDLESYNKIFVGTPNWCNTMAPPLFSFLVKNDFSNKTIIPFCTHGGGGMGKIEADIKKACPRAAFLPAFEIYGNGGENAKSLLDPWLQKAGLVIR